MRTLIAVLLLAAPAYAQTKTAPAQGQPPKALTQRTDGHFSANSDPAGADQFEVHVVKMGDTLSGIAKTVLNDGKLWPQLWEINEHIVNPHWIYPNDQILIKKIVKLTEVVPAVDEPKPVVEVPVSKPPAEPEFELVLPKAPVVAVVEEVETEAPPKAIQYPTLILSARLPPVEGRKGVDQPLPAQKLAPEVKQTDLSCSGYIRTNAAPSDLKMVGRFNGDSSALAAAADYIYMNLGNGNTVKTGATFQVVRPTKQIDDPARKGAERNLGMHYMEVGQVQVVMLQLDFALARVTTSCEPLEIGDAIVPVEAISVPQPPRPRPFSPTMTASGEAKGTVVTSKNVLVNFGSTFKGSNVIAGTGQGQLKSVEQGIAADGHIVYLNIGKSSGAKPGETFIVFRDPGTDRKIYPLPLEASVLANNRIAIGEVLILRVEEKATTALVTYAADGIAMGDTVERRSR